MTQTADGRLSGQPKRQMYRMGSAVLVRAKINDRKHHILLDTLGLLLAIVVTVASV